VLISALRRRGVSAPFAIQAAALPDALAGADVLGRAVTGSGKTLGFGLPLLVRLAGGPRRPRLPRGLVLAPTRELAQQVNDVLAPLAQSVGVRVTTVYGGVSMGRQINALDRGVDIVVATPGRLVDLLERRALSLDGVQIAVLDEADHLCDLGFLPVIRRLLALLPVGGQRMLFSATLDGDVDTITREFLAEPVLVDVAPPVEDLAPVIHRVLPVADRAAKAAAVAELAASAERGLLFVRTKHGADRLAKQLSLPGAPVRSLHGGLTQSARTRALAAFAAGQARTLVATDVAARGLDVDGIDLVVHVDPPTESKAFVHRSGRTGRAGAAGTVITLALPEERSAVRTLLRAAGVEVASEPDEAEVAPVRTAPRPNAARRAPQRGEGRARTDGSPRSQPRRRGQSQSSRSEPGRRLDAQQREPQGQHFRRGRRQRQS
jgi:superfamily II DNA/RNA helicase